MSFGLASVSADQGQYQIWKQWYLEHMCNTWYSVSAVGKWQMKLSHLPRVIGLSLSSPDNDWRSEPNTTLYDHSSELRPAALWVTVTEIMSWCSPCSVLRMFQSGPKPCAGHHLGGVRVSLWARWVLHPSDQVLHVRAPDPLPHAGLQVQVPPGTVRHTAVLVVSFTWTHTGQISLIITVIYTDVTEGFGFKPRMCVCVCV